MDHWERLYADSEPNRLSWYQAEPTRSVELVEATKLPKDAAILDVGGGTSKLAARLLQQGYRDVTVADVSSQALEQAKASHHRPDEVTWVGADVRVHDFGRQFDLWHDRAVFHFMVEVGDRDGYLGVLRRTLRPGGHAIFATFGPDGPRTCSGLPVRRYDGSALSTLLGSDFDLIESGDEMHETPGGATQHFVYTWLRRAGRND